MADALDSGSSESNFMQVQVLFPAPQKKARRKRRASFFVNSGNGLEEAVMNQAPVGLENGADRAATSRENPVLFPAPNENFRENGSFYLLQRNIKAKTGLEEAVVNQTTVWPESGADRAAARRENPVLFSTLNQYNPNQIFQIGNGFGFFLIFLSQRYNPLDLASKVSMQGAEIPRNPCEIIIQQSSYRDILLLRNMVYFVQ